MHRVMLVTGYWGEAVAMDQAPFGDSSGADISTSFLIMFGEAKEFYQSGGSVLSAQHAC